MKAKKARLKPATVIFMRHGEAAYAKKGGPLTGAGRAFSRAAGKKFPGGFRRIKVHYSPMLRAEQTGLAFARGMKAKKVSRYQAIREKKRLGYIHWAKNPQEYSALFRKLGAFEFTKRWIGNDTEVLGVAEKANVVADEFIRQSRLGEKLAERNARGILIGKFTHGSFPELILNRLTGIDFAEGTIPKNTACRNNEYLKLEFKNKGVFLTYRNLKGLDVTEKYREVVAEARKVKHSS